MAVRWLPASLRAGTGLPGGWRTVAIAGIVLSPIPAFLFSMLLGTYGLGVADVIGVIWSRLTGTVAYDSTVYAVLFDIRLPRVLAAMLVGASMSVAGAALQGVLRNPLVDPYILGLSSGAAFGAALAIAVVPWLPVQLSAFAFGLLAMGLAYSMARSGGRVPIVSLILSGVIASAVFTALLSIVQINAHERSLQSIVRWIMGSFNAVTWPLLGSAWWLMVAGTVLMIALRWRLNVLALGDDEARSAGLNVERYKAVFIVCAALVSAAGVSIVGIVALVGLIVPHMVRMVAGPDHRTLLPLSAALGATYLVLVDDIARAALGYEVPLSIITTLIGAPFFWVLLRSTKASGWE
ncbi:MAG: FecCD family ABC transporter permease [Chloroflexota bacterium]